MHGDVTAWSAARVRALRQKLGLSQERFAARIGTTAGTVSRWEAGSRKPLRMAQERLAEIEAVENSGSETAEG